MGKKSAEGKIEDYQIKISQRKILEAILAKAAPQTSKAARGSLKTKILRHGPKEWESRKKTAKEQIPSRQEKPTTILLMTYALLSCCWGHQGPRMEKKEMKGLTCESLLQANMLTWILLLKTKESLIRRWYFSVSVGKCRLVIFQWMGGIPGKAKDGILKVLCVLLLKTIPIP